MRHLVAIAALILAPFVAPFATADDAIRVLVRGDDMGVAEAINDACIKSYRAGVVRSVEVIVPGGWFLDAAKLLKENPALDAGAHLCLTSEWDRCKWRPLTHAPSLVDADGYFYAATKQRPDLPPHSGLLDEKPKLDEVEAELKAQIELARRHIPQLSHVSAHMYTVRSSPEIEAIARRLAKQFGLRFDDDGMTRSGYWGGSDSVDHEKRLVIRLETLTPGTHLIITHPGLDTPELRGFGNNGSWEVAQERAATTAALTSSAAKDVIAKRHIKLISYLDLK
jgi:predicted glycoside hydrolase/deacetylase ChbG (UPF0249 family)